jgi:hypothetical protein
LARILDVTSDVASSTETVKKSYDTDNELKKELFHKYGGLLAEAAYKNRDAFTPPPNALPIC